MIFTGWMFLPTKIISGLHPQISFTSGTQKFGFNQTTSTYAANLRNATNVLYNTGDVYLDDQLKFQPLSLTLYLRREYSIGKFFIQPQFIFDYYFPANRADSMQTVLTTTFLYGNLCSRVRQWLSDAVCSQPFDLVVSHNIYIL